jgi:hypothetical protein
MVSSTRDYCTFTPSHCAVHQPGAVLQTISYEPFFENSVSSGLITHELKIQCTKTGYKEILAALILNNCIRILIPIYWIDILQGRLLDHEAQKFHSRLTLIRNQTGHLIVPGFGLLENTDRF